MYYEDYRAIGNAGFEGIKLVVSLVAIYYLFMMVKAVIFFCIAVFIENPNLFIPIIVFLVLGLTWRISSTSSSLDWGIGLVTIHVASFLIPCLAYYYIYTTLSVDNINAITAYNQQALQWVQSFDSILHYGAWAIYILTFTLMLTVFALPIRFTRKIAKRIVDKAYNAELYILGDIIIISVILCIATFLLSVMDSNRAVEALQSFEINTTVLIATTLLTAIIGWRKFVRSPY